MSVAYAYKPAYPYKGKLRFSCGDRRLCEGFQWAKERALHYAHEGDPVGDWCEAALPGRAAFCMRDVSHQAVGAQALGLAPHNKNMLLRLAQGIAQSRDFCSFWEIGRDYAPAPVDYTSDGDFWYNLPANFDVLDACWRMYLWTGDRDYLDSADFRHFYDLTMHEYVRRWDLGGGIMGRREPGGRRGIPSYNEDYGYREAVAMLDLCAVRARACLSYAEISREQGELARAAGFEAEGERLLTSLERDWWDAMQGTFYTARTAQGAMVHIGGAMAAPAYYGAVRDREKLCALLDELERGPIPQVEGLSHYPEIFYRYGQPEEGLRWLLRLTDPGLPRREYPEASYAAVGCYVTGLMGLGADARRREVLTRPQLPAGVESAALECCPVFGGAVDFSVQGKTLRLCNRTGGEILWRGRRLKDGEEQTVEEEKA